MKFFNNLYRYFMVTTAGLCAFGGGIDVAYCDVVFHGPFPSHPPDLPPPVIRPPFPGNRPPPHNHARPHLPRRTVAPYLYEYKRDGSGDITEDPYLPQYERTNPVIRHGKSCVNKICIEN